MRTVSLVTSHLKNWDLESMVPHGHFFQDVVSLTSMMCPDQVDTLPLSISEVSGRIWGLTFLANSLQQTVLWKKHTQQGKDFATASIFSILLLLHTKPLALNKKKINESSISIFKAVVLIVWPQGKQYIWSHAIKWMHRVHYLSTMPSKAILVDMLPRNEALYQAWSFSRIIIRSQT